MVWRRSWWCRPSWSEVAVIAVRDFIPWTSYAQGRWARRRLSMVVGNGPKDRPSGGLTAWNRSVVHLDTVDRRPPVCVRRRVQTRDREDEREGILHAVEDL